MSFIGIRQTYSDKALRDIARSFRRIVFWGLNQGIHGTHTHRHIFRAYFETCRKLGLEAVWLSDRAPCEDITAQDLVFIHGTNHNLGSVLDKEPVVVDFHTDICAQILGPLYDRIKAYPRRLTELERRMPQRGFTEEWDPMTHYNHDLRILSQPWGSDLLPQEFLPPAPCFHSDRVYWVGSWWHNESEHWGNIRELGALRAWLAARGMKFVLLHDCDSVRNALFVRHSRLAPALGGQGQVEANYIACRLFKNIAYGQFCISNVPRSQDILEGTALYDADIPSLMDRALSVSPQQARELVAFQQDKIKNHTVAAHLYIIFHTAHAYCAARKVAA